MPRLIKEKELSALSKLAISELPRTEVNTLCGNLFLTTVHLFGRVNQNSTNTDLSPSSDKGRQKKQPDPNAPGSKQHNRADVRKKRAKGSGRTQVLKTTTEEAIKPDACTDCHTPFLVSALTCYTAFYQIELVKLNDEGYYRVVQTKYSLYDGHCPTCNTTTRATIAAYSIESDHKKISRQGIIGPTLTAEIIAFHKENGTSTRKIRKTIECLYGIKLSVGAIIEAINNGGLCCEPTVETYRVEATQADLANMDETTWRNAGKRLWLWVVITHNACIFTIGQRTKEMAQEFLSNGFVGWLMSDGYRAYRHYTKRFRCWAHLTRKAQGCADSASPDISAFGTTLLALLGLCKDGIYEARVNDSTASLLPDFAQELAHIKALCETYQDSPHDKAKALAREFLNDWDAIFRVLEYPDYPLTNNEAERALRHWVILRKVIQGTQSEDGQRGTCAIASMIATGKCRGQDFVKNIKGCIDTAKGVLNHVSYKPLRLSG